MTSDQTAPAVPTSAELVELVTAVPGVVGIEPGIGTTLRALDARVRRSGTGHAHFGLHIDTGRGTVVVEVSLDRSRPIRETVRDIQNTLVAALSAEAPGGASGRGGDGRAVVPTVRVQSLG